MTEKSVKRRRPLRLSPVRLFFVGLLGLALMYAPFFRLALRDVHYPGLADIGFMGVVSILAGFPLFAFAVWNLITKAGYSHIREHEEWLRSVDELALTRGKLTQPLSSGRISNLDIYRLLLSMAVTSEERSDRQDRSMLFVSVLMLVLGFAIGLIFDAAGAADWIRDSFPS